MLNRRLQALACALILGAGPAGSILVATPAAAQAPATTGPVVNINNFVFGPAVLTVPVGATVTWINHDDDPHTVVADDRSFKSKALDTDEKFSFTFSKPGEYSYFCSVHPHMTGKVVVKG
jgi:plastocyanin